MKRKKILTLATGLVVLGGVIFATGTALGGSTELRWNRNRFEIIDFGEQVDINENLSSFSNIVAVGGDYRLEIVRGSEFKIEAQVTEFLEFAVTKDTLYLQAPHTTGTISFGFGGRRNWHNQEVVTIHVPVEELNADISIDTGHIITQGVSFRDSNIRTSTGRIDIEGATLTGTQVSTATGSIHLNDTDLIGNSRIDANTGSVSIEGNMTGAGVVRTRTGRIEFNGQLEGDHEFRTSTGNIELNVRGNRNNYTYDLSSNTGNVRVDGERSREGNTGGRASSQGGENSIRAAASTGRIDLNFR